ncbi:LuxR C-terminal-related transcriptional regulator [Lysinibacillus antri]|uniref:LuxR C-terminal-related transcriptional regulator n=1 Tax=Lysinibacillus antri TaxID=2498145 RepID=UPI0034E0B4B2
MLSDKEIDVVNLLKKGWTNQTIATSLQISVNIVKKTYKIFMKNIAYKIEHN